MTPPPTFRLNAFTFADRHGRVYELRRFTPRSRGGTVIAQRIVRAGAPLSAHRDARRELKAEIPEGHRDT